MNILCFALLLGQGLFLAWLFSRGITQKLLNDVFCDVKKKARCQIL